MGAYTVSFLLWIVTLQWISAHDYSSQWAAHIEGGIEIAKSLTEKHGFVLLGEVNCHIIYISISVFIKINFYTTVNCSFNKQFLTLCVK